MSEISIETTKADYAGGDVVEGKVVLTLDDAIPMRGVRIRFEGYEKSFWRVGSGRDPSDLEETARLFDEKRTLAGRPSLSTAELVKDALSGVFSKDQYEVLDAGTHEWPFTFELPEKLPGDYESPRGSAVRYWIHAYVDIPLRVDLEASKRLTVHDSYDPADVQPVAATNDKTFLFDSSGPLEVSLALDRNMFFPGDETQCTVKIHNRSSKRIDAVRIAVRQIEELQANELVGHNEYDILVAEKEEPGIERGEPCELELDLELPADVYATLAASRLVRVRYELVATLDVPWARDLEVAVPIIFLEKAGMPSGVALPK